MCMIPSSNTAPVFPVQSRLYEEPHRFLRAALLWSAAARGRRLDLSVHNRVRPDVRLRIPAGVVKEWARGRRGERLLTGTILHSDCKPHPVRIRMLLLVTATNSTCTPAIDGEQEEEEFNGFRGVCSTTRSPRLVSRDVSGFFRTSTYVLFYFCFLPVTLFCCF